MSSFSVQGCKNTLHCMQKTASKVIPQAGVFLGKVVTVISANPLATAAVVAAVIVVSLVVFATYKHYQYHQQLKADNASLNRSLEVATDNTEMAVNDLKKENKKITVLVKEKEILEIEKEYYKSENEIIKNELKLDYVNFAKEITRNIKFLKMIASLRTQIKAKK